LSQFVSLSLLPLALPRAPGGPDCPSSAAGRESCGRRAAAPWRGRCPSQRSRWGWTSSCDSCVCELHGFVSTLLAGMSVQAHRRRNTGSLRQHCRGCMTVSDGTPPVGKVAKGIVGLSVRLFSGFYFLFLRYVMRAFLFFVLCCHYAHLRFFQSTRKEESGRTALLYLQSTCSALVTLIATGQVGARGGGTPPPSRCKHTWTHPHGKRTATRCAPCVAPAAPPRAFWSWRWRGQAPRRRGHRPRRAHLTSKRKRRRPPRTGGYARANRKVNSCSALWR